MVLPKGKDIIDLTDEQFFQLCQNNRDLRFERTATGELIIMPPRGSETGDRFLQNQHPSLGLKSKSNSGSPLKPHSQQSTVTLLMTDD